MRPSKKQRTHQHPPIVNPVQAVNHSTTRRPVSAANHLMNHLFQTYDGNTATRRRYTSALNAQSYEFAHGGSAVHHIPQGVPTYHTVKTRHNKPVHIVNHVIHRQLVRGANPKMITYVNSRPAFLKDKKMHDKPVLVAAATHGMYDTVKTLLRKGIDPNTTHNGMERTPLLVAARAGHEQIVRLLLEYGANVNLQAGPFKETALYHAAMKGYVQIVSLLLQHHADPNIANSWNHTPLIVAAEHNQIAVVRLLLHHGARVDVQGNDGRTALTIALKYNHKDIVKLLLQRGAGSDIYGRDGHTASKVANLYGHQNLMELIEKHKRN